MNGNPGITVVIPTYNAAPYLRRALESVFNQTHPPREVVVVDDGSTDDTAAVISDYTSRVTYLLQSNAGPSVARNRGVSGATSMWVAFLDADDFWEVDKLKKQLDALARKPKAVLSYSDFTVRYGDGRERRVLTCPPDKLMPTIRFRCPFGPPMVLVSRSAFLRVGGFDPSLRNGEDWDLWVRFALMYGADGFAYVPESLTSVCVAPGSLSQRTHDQFRQCRSLVEHRLLAGLRGTERYVWRRKILARMYRDLAVALREEGATDHLHHMLASLWLWPFPDDAVQSDRYKIAAHMAWTTLQRKVIPFVHT